MTSTLKLLIAGRSGSGKDTLKDHFIEQGCTAVCSYTTRPKRFPSENTHKFLTLEEAQNFPASVRAASTKIGPYEYFSTKDQVEQSDIYVIDYHGIKDLCRNMPDQQFLLLYMDCESDCRREHAILRSDNEKEAEVFEKREQAECQQFTALENAILTGNLPNNIYKTFYLKNDYRAGTLEGYAQLLLDIHFGIEQMFTDRQIHLQPASFYNRQTIQFIPDYD